MHVAIIGYGVEGQSACTYWQALGADVTICDQNTSIAIPFGATAQLGEGYLRSLGKFDVIVRSPGIRPQDILAQNPGIEAKITTVINEFLRVCPTKHVIGITGTKGKGTTSTLIATMLEAAGKAVFLGGNIGNSPLDLLHQLTPESWVVLELSSFQLYDMRYAPHIAVCLMVLPEHLNWHSDLDDYIQAKSNLFRHQQPNDIAIYYADNEASHTIASTSPGAKISYYAAPGALVQDNAIVIDSEVICNVNEIRLLGKHNWQNACAAVTAVWQATKDVAAIRSVLTTFPGLEHRLELVRTIDGVAYYDDSFGTTPETAIVALDTFPQPKVIILGGSDKGLAYDELAEAVTRSNVRAVIAIGVMGPIIGATLRAKGFTAIIPGGDTMPEIVQAAKNAAKKGDVVLLSTGCASFGMFKNYKDRGVQFKTAVGAL